MGLPRCAAHHRGGLGSDDRSQLAEDTGHFRWQFASHIPAADRSTFHREFPGGRRVLAWSFLEGKIGIPVAMSKDEDPFSPFQRFIGFRQFFLPKGETKVEVKSTLMVCNQSELKAQTGVTAGQTLTALVGNAELPTDRIR